MAITTIRPNDTAYTGSWRKTPEGFTDLHSPTSDNSDSTYIRTQVGWPAYGNYCRIRAGDVAPSANQRIMRVRVRVRYAKNGIGGATQRFVISLADPTEGTVKLGKIVDVTSTTETTSTYEWWTTSPSNRDWTTEVINRINFYLVGYQNLAKVDLFPHVIELYADVDIHSQVSISGLTVTGHTTSARPTVGWTFNTNADNDPQRSFQVKIFTDAQTNAAGFNAATSEAVWDSGVVRSTAESVVVDSSLVNGVTYTAYVRASSDFNNTDWWTAYSASSDFTMAYVAPPAPTLTVTPETVLPSLRNLLVVDTKLNLLSAADASFEEATTGSWGAQTNCAVVVSTTQKLDGAQSMRMTATGAGNMSAITAGGVFPYQVKAGQQYTALASFRAGTTGRSCRVAIQWVDQTGANLGAVVNGSNVSDTNAGFTQGFVTATAPAGVYGARVIVEVLAAAAAEIHYVDKADLHTGSSTTWTAGGLQKNGSFGTRFDRTVIEYLDRTVPSADTTNLLYINIATGGDANGDTHGFAPRNAKDIVDVDRLGRQFQGEVCIRWQVGEAVGSVLDLGTAQGVFSSFSETPEAVLPGVPGRTYTLSLYVRGVSGALPNDLALAIRSIDATGATVGSESVGSTVAVNTSWTRLTVTHTMVANSAGMRGELRNLDGDLAEYLLDAGQLEEGSTATPWKRASFLFPSWQKVRGAFTALQADVRDGVARIYDREAPPGVIRMYRAWTEVDAGGGAFTRSAYTSYIPTQMDFPADCTHILKDPQQPAWDVQLNVEQVGEHIDEDFTEAHPVRPNDRQPYGKRPVFFSDWISGKNGQLVIRVHGDEDWFALQTLLHTPRTLLLQIHDNGQRYVRFTSRSWPRSKQSTELWKVVVDCSEAARPVVTE